MRALRLLLVHLVLLVGCGGETGSARDARGDEAPRQSAASSSTPTTAAGGPATQALQRYLEVFAVGDAARLRSDLVPLTAPGSLARLYSDHQTAFRQALEESGAAPPREDTVEASGDGVQICTGEVMCRTYTDPVLQDGLLTDFTVNDEPLAGHVVQPGARASAGGLTVELVSGYETSRRALFVCVRAANAGAAPVSLNASTATYPGPDGAPAMAAQAPGTLDPIPAGGSAVVCPVFRVGQPGGRLRLEVSGTAAPPTTLEIAVDAAPG